MSTAAGLPALFSVPARVLPTSTHPHPSSLPVHLPASTPTTYASAFSRQPTHLRQLRLRHNCSSAVLAGSHVVLGNRGAAPSWAGLPRHGCIQPVPQQRQQCQVPRAVQAHDAPKDSGVATVTVTADLAQLGLFDGGSGSTNELLFPGQPASSTLGPSPQPPEIIVHGLAIDTVITAPGLPTTDATTPPSSLLAYSPTAISEPLALVPPLVLPVPSGTPHVGATPAPALAAAAVAAEIAFAAPSATPATAAAAAADPPTPPADQKSPTQQAQPHPQQQQSLLDRLTAATASVNWPKVWALALLSISYIHQATTGFALPAMLPMISNELHLSDLQGALLTTGYSYLYAVALVPIGLLADRLSRPRLLAGGLALWSILTCVASGCRNFSELLLARVGFAAAQGAQNPVCFSLIPELFPANKATALSLYNCAIYVGRALSFGAVLLARHLHDNDQAHLAARGGLRVVTQLDHLDRADLHSMAIMHAKGDMAAAAPDAEFNFPLAEYGAELPDSAWRQVLRWIAVPGFIIAVAMMLTLKEPRQQPEAAPAPAAAAQVAAVPQAAPGAPPVAGAPALVAPEAQQAVAQPQPAKPVAHPEGGSILDLLRSPGFMSVTLAAALNDVGSYALIAWQSTFYERVYGLESSAYAPVLAVLLPIGGIIGGVGGGYLADVLSRTGRRWWVTAGATVCAAPCLAASCLAPSPEWSYAALLVGFALSECWRAPAAVMARGVAPASMGSSASATYLCVRNLVGGLGPLGVAGMIGVIGLQRAMLLVPLMYLGSGLLFFLAERLLGKEMEEREQRQQRRDELAAAALELAQAKA